MIGFERGGVVSALETLRCAVVDLRQKAAVASDRDLPSREIILGLAEIATAIGHLIQLCRPSPIGSGLRCGAINALVLRAQMLVLAARRAQMRDIVDASWPTRCGRFPDGQAALAFIEHEIERVNEICATAQVPQGPASTANVMDLEVVTRARAVLRDLGADRDVQQFLECLATSDEQDALVAREVLFALQVEVLLGPTGHERAETAARSSAARGSA